SPSLNCWGGVEPLIGRTLPHPFQERPPSWFVADGSQIRIALKQSSVPPSRGGALLQSSQGLLRRMTFRLGRGVGGADRLTARHLEEQFGRVGAILGQFVGFLLGLRHLAGSRQRDRMGGLPGPVVWIQSDQVVPDFSGSLVALRRLIALALTQGNRRESGLRERDEWLLRRIPRIVIEYD